jgi:hypothetical protein
MDTVIEVVQFVLESISSHLSQVISDKATQQKVLHVLESSSQELIGSAPTHQHAGRGW